MVSRVWFYVPNVIGYIRVLTAIAAVTLAFTPSALPLFFWIYGFSYFLDALDGVAARALNQVSRFGAVLDMVTDRICTAALLSVLAHNAASNPEYPAWMAPVYTFLMMLDVGAHWVQMYSALSVGAESHKNVSDEPAIIRWYYKRVNLFLVCLFNEVNLMVSLLVISGSKIGVWPFANEAPKDLHILTSYLPFPFQSQTSWAVIIFAFTLPVFLLKQLLSIIQLTRSLSRIVSLDTEMIMEAKKKSRRHSVRQPPKTGGDPTPVLPELTSTSAEGKKGAEDASIELPEEKAVLHSPVRASIPRRERKNTPRLRRAAAEKAMEQISARDGDSAKQD